MLVCIGCITDNARTWFSGYVFELIKKIDCCPSDVLADNGRLTITGEVITAFGKMMSAHRGEVLCTVTTAHVRTTQHACVRAHLHFHAVLWIGYIVAVRQKPGVCVYIYFFFHK